MAINFPDSPSVDEIYSVGDKSWLWNGTYWEVQGSPTSTFSASDTAPASPNAGDIWYRSDTSQTLIYYDSTWVEIGHSANIANFLADADADTKIQLEESSDDDTIRFDTAGVERMTIGASGDIVINNDLTVDTSTLHVDSTTNRVGIGTTSPNETLDVQGSIGFSTGGGRTAGSLFSDGNWGLITTAAQSSPALAEFAWFNADDTERMRIDTSGNVGINNSTPSYRLDVTGDINASGDVRIAGTSLGRGVLDFQESGGDFSLSTSPIDIMNITFTLASTRKVMIAASIPLVDLVSATTTNTSNIFQDTNAAGSPANYYGQFHATTTTHGLGQATYYNVATLTAGTYTVYWVALTNSGTVRYNGQTGFNRRHQLTAIDLGAG